MLDACRPVVVIADTPPAIVTPDQTLSLALHAVSDLHHEIRPVRVTARAQLQDWLIERRWEGELAADSCTYIGTVHLRIPNRTGALVLDLELEAGDRVVSNRYQTGPVGLLHSSRIYIAQVDAIKKTMRPTIGDCP